MKVEYIHASISWHLDAVWLIISYPHEPRKGIGRARLILLNTQVLKSNKANNLEAEKKKKPKSVAWYTRCQATTTPDLEASFQPFRT